MNLEQIADEVGTPCYVYSRNEIESRWTAFDSALAGRPHLVCYAVKANSNLAVLNVMARLGSGFDIVSKATTPVSTCAAVNQLRQRPIHLLLGGLSKGLNRESLVAQLKNNVKTIICFGAEAPQLYAWCTHYKIPATQHKTLEDAFEKCARNAHENDIVLLAPGGSSFDLFANFQERGNRFKSLTRELQKQYDTGKRESLCIRHKNDSTPI